MKRIWEQASMEQTCEMKTKFKNSLKTYFLFSNYQQNNNNYINSNWIHDLTRDLIYAIVCFILYIHIYIHISIYCILYVVTQGRFCYIVKYLVF